MKKEWYENTEWNAWIEDEFERRLIKSRDPYHRAQYIRIQAETLDIEYIEVKKRLLNRVINEYSKEDFQVKMAMDSLANIYYKEDKFDEAIKLYTILYEDDVKMKKEKIGGYSAMADIKLLKLIMLANRKDKYPACI